MKTHLDRPLVVNPQDNRNNNTNKTQPGALPLEQQYRRQDLDHYRRAARCHSHHRHVHPKASGTDAVETVLPVETRMEHGFSCTSLGNVEANAEVQPGQERHGHRSHRGHRHRTREGRDGRGTCSASPHRGEAAEGNGEHRRSRHHRRAAKDGEEGRRHRSRGTQGDGEKGEEGEARKTRRHRHDNRERSRGHRTRK